MLDICEAELVMTLPDTPNAPQQAYRSVGVLA